MNFSSVSFLFYFLPIFLSVYFLSRRSNVVLLIGSAVFYAWGELANAWVLLLSLAGCYLFGLAIAAAALHSRKRRWWMAFGVAFQLLLLSTFKYAGFMLANLDALGLHVMADRTHLPSLPIGISFFTFHAISYLIDCYRGAIAAERSLLALANYLLLFPHLLAGPIVRYIKIKSQLVKRHCSMARTRLGIELLLVGLAQKLLLANTLAAPVDAIFGLERQALSAGVAWLGGIGYAFQIYMDFSGYSHMALGLALMLGFGFPRNFNFPFLSRSVGELWRRWHISLASWLRDYVYLPLGGSRLGTWRTHFNVLLVFTLCGLWHGAGWTFVLWGAYNGLFIVLERAGLAKRLARWPGVLQQGYCCLVFVVGVVLFRSDDLAQAGRFYVAMTGWSHAAETAPLLQRYLDTKTLAALAMASLSLFPLRRWMGGGHFARPRWPLVRLVFFSSLLLLCAMTLAGGSHNPFLYFRF